MATDELKDKSCKFVKMLELFTAVEVNTTKRVQIFLEKTYNFII